MRRNRKLISIVIIVVIILFIVTMVFGNCSTDFGKAVSLNGTVAETAWEI